MNQRSRSRSSAWRSLVERLQCFWRARRKAQGLQRRFQGLPSVGHAVELAPRRFAFGDASRERGVGLGVIAAVEQERVDEQRPQPGDARFELARSCCWHGLRQLELAPTRAHLLEALMTRLTQRPQPLTADQRRVLDDRAQLAQRGFQPSAAALGAVQSSRDLLGFLAQARAREPVAPVVRASAWPARA